MHQCHQTVNKVTWYTLAASLKNHLSHKKIFFITKHSQHYHDQIYKLMLLISPINLSLCPAMKPVLTKLEPTSPRQRDILSTQRSPPSWKYWHFDRSTWHKVHFSTKPHNESLWNAGFLFITPWYTKHCLLDVTRPVWTLLCSRLLRWIDRTWVPFDSCHWWDPLSDPKHLQMHGHALGPGTNVTGGQIVAIGLSKSRLTGITDSNTQVTYFDSSLASLATSSRITQVTDTTITRHRDDTGWLLQSSSGDGFSAHGTGAAGPGTPIPAD